MSKEELASLATQHNTDKWNYHWYADAYAAHFEQMREQEINILEIGVGGYDDPNAGGGSLRMWRDYFPKAKVIGLDYHDKRALAEERIHIYQGSQADPVAIAKMVADFPEGFDIIVDDGSHRNDHVIASFYMLWQYVKSPGWYVVEDLQTSYWPNHGGQIADRNSPLTSMGLLKSLIDGLNWQEIHQPTYAPSLFETTISSISFYHNIAFLRKDASVNKNSTEVRHNRINGV